MRNTFIIPAVRAALTIIFAIASLFTINAQSGHGHDHAAPVKSLPANLSGVNTLEVPAKEWISYIHKAAPILKDVEVNSFLNYIILQADGDFTDLPYFINYIQVRLKKDRDLLIFKIGKGSITTLAEAKKHFADLHPVYTAHYAEFMKRRDVIIADVNANTMRAPGSGATPTPFNCGSPCTNPGFETGTTSFWDGSTGTACTSPDPCGMTAGFSSSQHLVTTVGTYDATVGGTTLPTVPPGGGNNALRLCDGPMTGGYAARASISFTVSAANANFTYRYAVVLQDPVSGHTDPERPYFRVKIRDASGNVVTCGDYEVIAKPPLVGFVSLGSNVYYRPWTTVFVPLSSYIGQCITVEFTASDCSQTGHYGYAYVDADCDPLALLSSSPSVCGGNTVVLTAPAGAASYTWSNTAGGSTGIVGATNGQTCTVDAGGTYQCVMTSVSGPTCTTTLNITVGSSPSNPVAGFTNTTVCSGAATVFTDTSTPVGSLDAWAWDFNNDGVTDDTNQNPSFTFAGAGTYPVTLTITWDACTATITQNVTVNAGIAPTINPAGPFCVTAAGVTLSSGTAGGTWSGTGITNAATGAFDPAVAGAGSHVISYTVGGSCPGTDTETIIVNALPVSDAGPDVTICSATSGTIGSANDPANTYSWSPATGLSATNVSNPTVTLTNAGPGVITSTYTLITTVTATGCSSSDMMDVSVDPIATANAGPPQTICAGTSATLAGSVGGSATGGTWGGGAGTYSPNNNTLNAVYTPTAAEEAAGSITLTLVSNDPAGPCPVATSTVTISINPVAVINAGPDQAICIGSSCTLAGSTSGSATSGTWSGGAGSFAPSNTDPNAVYTPTAAEAAAGSVILTYTSDDPAGPCSFVTDQMVITINALPTANAGSTQSVCKGSTITLNGAVGGSASSGTWSGGAGTFSPNANTLNAVYTPTAAEYAAGSVTLTLTTNDPAGPCTFTTASVTHNFYEAPVVSFSVDDPSGCPVHCVQFSDASVVAGATITQWNWDFGYPTADSTSQNPSHCFANTGFYDITLTVTSSQGCSASATILQMIQVFAMPVAEFTPTPNPATVLDPEVTLNNGCSPDVNVWYYYFGDGDSTAPYTPSPVHVYPDESSASYLATLIVQNTDGCWDTVQHEVLIGPEFTFFIPNAFTPNGDGINDFFYGNGIGIVDYNIWIFDRWGQMIWTGDHVYEMWDGKANHGSEMAQQDVYVWKVKLTDVFGKKHNYMGTVTLVK